MKPYTNITEVDRAEIAVKRASEWQTLAYELRLRLERTADNKALRLDFDTPKAASLAAEAIRRNMPDAVVKLRQCSVYVARKVEK